MKKKLMLAYVKGNKAVENAVNNFKSDERGASDMVTVVILIAIVIAIAIFFKDELTKFVQRVFGQLGSF